MNASMSNHPERQEEDDLPGDRRCVQCDGSLSGRRRDSKWCSARCRMRWKRRQKSLERARASYSAVHPDVDLSVFSDGLDVPDDEQGEDDEAGIIAVRSGLDYFQDRSDAFARQQALADRIERIRSDYDARMAPFTETQRRNPGVVLPHIAVLQRKRDAEIDAIQREAWRAEAREMAAREQPRNIVSAHERAVGKAAATAFASDLGRGRHLRDEPADVGRDVHDVFYWG